MFGREIFELLHFKLEKELLSFVRRLKRSKKNGNYGLLDALTKEDASKCLIIRNESSSADPCLSLEAQSGTRQIMIRYKTQLGRSDSSGRTKSLASCIHVPYLCYLYQARLHFRIAKSQLSKLRYKNYATDKRAIRIGH